MAAKTVLVTGGTKGIGLATARLLLSKGHPVILLARDEARLSEVKAGFVAEGFREADIETLALDMADGDGIASQVPRLRLLAGGLFGLVNNAANDVLKRVTDFTRDDLELIWRVNMRAPILMIQACYPFLKRAGGAVVNVGSVSDGEHSAYYSLYGGSKAFLNSFTRHVAKELGFDGICINVVTPGGVDTPMMEAVMSGGPFARDEIEKQLATIPIEQRWGRPAEIAEAIYFALTGPKYLHGADIRVHGGVE